MKNNVILTALALAFTSSIAFADDINKPEVIQVPADQAATMPEKSYVMRYDTDNDGTVDFNEYKALHPKATKNQFSMLDKDGDGTLDEQELSKARKAYKKYQKKRDKEIKRIGTTSGQTDAQRSLNVDDPVGDSKRSSLKSSDPANKIDNTK